MEIYQGISVNDELTLGDMKAIKKAFGKRVTEIKFDDSEETSKLICVLARSHDKECDAESLVDKIPLSKLGDVCTKLADMMTGAIKDNLKGNLQESEGNESPQA
jgi:hypothetical protein